MISSDSNNLEAFEKKEADIERLIKSLTSDLNVVRGAKQVMKRDYTIESDFIILPSKHHYLPTPTIAVRELLEKNPKAWSFSEIITELNRTGVKSNAKSLASPVSAALRNLHAHSRITITGKKRKRKYKWSVDN
ncbi:MAG: hypothetical protein IIA58_00405 [Candidatus Marinimicrobia bacterium]|nr:hypothetical protein [Candidatus Neomarinimicrobiota bacterium]